MKYFHIVMTFMLFMTAPLFASAATQAVSLANDAYLPPEKFMEKYGSDHHELTAERALSINYYIFRQKNQLIVVFEGTNDLSSLKMDLQVGESDFLHLFGTQVHKGYYSEAQVAYKRVSPLVTKEQQVIVVGHSLGGAVGHLLAAILYKEGYNVRLFTFGEPPVGNEDFVHAVKGLDHQRYTHIFDMVPLLKKEYIEKLQDALSYVKTQLPENEAMSALVDALNAIPYTFVHQGEHHYIYNSPNLPTGYDERAWYERFIVRAYLYHSVQNYLEGVD